MQLWCTLHFVFLVIFVKICPLITQVGCVCKRSFFNRTADTKQDIVQPICVQLWSTFDAKKTNLPFAKKISHFILLYTFLFPFICYIGVALTAFHMIPTFLATYTTMKMKVFDHKPVQVIKMIPTSAFFSASIAFANLALVYNPIGVVLVCHKSTLALINLFKNGNRSSKSQWLLVLFFVTF